MKQYLFTISFLLPSLAFGQMHMMETHTMPMAAPMQMVMEQPMDMPMDHKMAMPMTMSDNASTKAYQKANHAMHMGMNIAFSNDADVDFIAGMIPHHLAAVEMAKIVREYGTNGKTKDIARRIMNAQAREIRLMEQMAHRMTFDPQMKNQKSTQAYQLANEIMHTDMNITFSDNADVDFIKGMIPHHQGAIEMAKIVLQYGDNPKVKNFAKHVIAAQTKEIREMNRWLRRLSYFGTYNPQF